MSSYREIVTKAVLGKGKKTFTHTHFIDVGKTPSTVSKWCQNTIQPDLKTLNEVSDLLGVDVTELIVSKNKQ